LNLAINAPVLFWLLIGKHCCSEIFRKQDWIKQFNAKHRNILDFLGYHASKSMVNFLRKTCLDEYRKDDFSLIHKVLKSRVLLKMMRHFPVVSRVHLKAAVQFPALMQCDFVRKKLLLNRMREDIFDNIASLYKDTLKVGRMTGSRLWCSPLSRPKTVKNKQ
jgi:hypothetical protein